MPMEIEKRGAQLKKENSQRRGGQKTGQGRNRLKWRRKRTAYRWRTKQIEQHFIFFFCFSRPYLGPFKFSTRMERILEASTVTAGDLHPLYSFISGAPFSNSDVKMVIDHDILNQGLFRYRFWGALSIHIPIW